MHHGADDPHECLDPVVQSIETTPNVLGLLWDRRKPGRRDNPFLLALREIAAILLSRRSVKGSQAAVLSLLPLVAGRGALGIRVPVPVIRPAVSFAGSNIWSDHHCSQA